MTNSKKLNNSSEIGIEHRYIDVELLKEQFEKHCEQVGESVDDWGMFYDEFPRMLADIPSADVQQVVHAKWIDNAHGSDFFGCSNCGFIYSYWDYDKYEYCPHCGAKMDGDEHE